MKLTKMMKSISRYRRNTAGNVAITFALSALGLILAGGCAIDYVRWARAQTDLQGVVDAAALAAAASPQTESDDLKAIATEYIDQNGPLLEVIKLEDPQFSYDSNSGRLSISLNGRVDMAFMSLAGVPEMDVFAESVVQQPSIPPVEAVLVLDTTYSMVGSKIDTLKTAAGNLVTSILANDEARVGIVPFASYVNVGVSRRNEPWANVPADSTTATESCSTTYPNAKNCTTTKTPSTCTSTKDGVTTTYACTKTSTTCESWGTPVKTCKPATSTSKFQGCMGSRAEAYRPVITSIDQKYPGMMNTTCAAEILELTDDDFEGVEDDQGTDGQWRNLSARRHHLGLEHADAGIAAHLCPAPGRSAEEGRQEGDGPDDRRRQYAGPHHRQCRSAWLDHQRQVQEHHLYQRPDRHALPERQGRQHRGLYRSLRSQGCDDRELCCAIAQPTPRRAMWQTMPAS